MTPIRLNVLDIHHGFLPFIISLGREPESDSDWITWDNDLIRLDFFSCSLYRSWEQRAHRPGRMSNTRRDQTKHLTPKKASYVCVWYLSEYLRTHTLAQESRTCYSLCSFELLSVFKSASLKVPTALIKVVQSETICNIPRDGGRQRTSITPHFLRVFKLARASRLSRCAYSVSSSKIRQPVAKSCEGKRRGSDGFQSVIMVNYRQL